MSIYNIENNGFTQTVRNVNLGITSSTTSMHRIKEVGIAGQEIASMVGRFAIARSTVLGVTPAAITPSQNNPRSAASAATCCTGFTTQPTFATVALRPLTLNLFGGVVIWRAAPGEELVIVGNTTGDKEITLSSTVGTGLATSYIRFEDA